MADQFQYVKLPDGSYGKFSATASDDDIKAAISKDFPKAFTPSTPTDLANQALAQNPKSAGLTVSPTTTPAPPHTAEEDDFGARVLTHVAANLAQMGQNALNPVSPKQRLQNLTNMRASDILPIQAIKDKDYSSAAGDLLTNGLIAAAAHKAGTVGGGEVVPKPMDVQGPSPMTVTPAETTARLITKAVNPPVQQWQGHIQAVAQEAGNIADYAKRTGNPLTTQLEWAKAARGAAQERNTFFNDQVLKPVADKPVDVNGDGQNIQTLGQINKRIGDINDMLRSAYQQRTQGQTMSALANEQELVVEKAQLTDILNTQLAQAHGVQPQDIANLRQSVGRLFSIADQTEGAVNQRASSAGKADEGRRDIPVGMGGLLEEAVSRLRGGPEGIGNRNFRNALATSQIEPTPLPDITITPNMTMQELEQAFQARLAARRAAKTSTPQK
jgi:hypothetical protein